MHFNRLTKHFDLPARTLNVRIILYLIVFVCDLNHLPDCTLNVMIISYLFSLKWGDYFKWFACVHTEGRNLFKSLSCVHTERKDWKKGIISSDFPVFTIKIISCGLLVCTLNVRIISRGLHMCWRKFFMWLTVCAHSTQRIFRTICMCAHWKGII